MTAPPVTEIYQPGTRPELFLSPSIFLSASVPYDRGIKPDQDPEAHEENHRYLATARPAEVREAVAHLCRFALARDINLIFGAHPAISPMVLDVARRFTTTPGRKRIIVFQSTYWRAGSIPRATLEIADWSAGELLWTDVRPNHANPDREQSLEWMRVHMLDSPNIIGAVFIGGMDGVKKEAGLLRALQRGVPRFAIGSTGSAASELLHGAPGEYRGHHVDVKLLSRTASYPLVMKHIFDDLGRL